MQTFVSIAIDSGPVVAGLDKVRAELGAPPRTNPDHITLAFLGDVDDQTAERVGTSLCSVEFTAFEIRIASVGSFGPKTSPRIVWAGIQDSGSLRVLAESVDAAIGPLGFSRERRLTPHITLFRVKNKSAGLTDVLAKHQNKVFGVQRVAAISLVRSEPSDGRHVHHILQTVGALAA